MSDSILKAKPVLVEWVDSMGSSGWGKLEPSNLQCVTVGQFISKTKDRITVALNQNSHGLYGEHIEIPMCSVTRIHHLKLGTSKRRTTHHRKG